MAVPHIGDHIKAFHPQPQPATKTPPKPMDFMGQLVNSDKPGVDLGKHYDRFGQQQAYEPASSVSFDSLADQYATDPDPKRLVLIKATLKELAQKLAELPFHANEKGRFADGNLHLVAVLDFVLKQLHSVIEQGKLDISPQSQAIRKLWDRFWATPEKLDNQQRTFLINHLVGMAAALHQSADPDGKLAGPQNLDGFHALDSGPAAVTHMAEPTHRDANTLASNLAIPDSDPLHVPVKPDGLTAIAAPDGPQVLGRDTPANRNLLRTAYPAQPAGDVHRWAQVEPRQVPSNLQHIRDRVQETGQDQTFEHVADPRMATHPGTQAGNYLIIHGSHDSQVVEAVRDFIKRNHIDKAIVEYHSVHKKAGTAGDVTSDGQKNVVVDLGNDPNPEDIKKIWDLISLLKKDFDVRAELHVHGTHAVPPGAKQVWAHHHQDDAGTYLVRHANEPDTNATPMWTHQ